MGPAGIEPATRGLKVRPDTQRDASCGRSTPPGRPSAPTRLCRVAVSVAVNLRASPSLGDGPARKPAPQPRVSSWRGRGLRRSSYRRARWSETTTGEGSTPMALGSKSYQPSSAGRPSPPEGPPRLLQACEQRPQEDLGPCDPPSGLHREAHSRQPPRCRGTQTFLGQRRRHGAASQIGQRAPQHRDTLESFGARHAYAVIASSNSKCVDGRGDDSGG